MQTTWEAGTELQLHAVVRFASESLFCQVFGIFQFFSLPSSVSVSVFQNIQSRFGVSVYRLQTIYYQPNNFGFAITITNLSTKHHASASVKLNKYSLSFITKGRHLQLMN
jgi:hypothetical protein